MPGPREVIEGVLRDCAPLVADRPHAAGALARVLLAHLGRAGLLPDCPMTWDTEWLAHDDGHKPVEAGGIVPGTTRVELAERAWDDAADCIRTDERLALVNPATFMYEPADTLAVYEVARAQGLPDDTPGDHPKVYRRDVVALRHPNARMLAEGRQAVTDLLAEVDRLRAERDEALRHVDTLRERCDALGKRDTGSDCIAVPPCAAVAERDEARVALDRVRALCSDHRATTTGYLHPADVLAAIDGGA